MNIFDKQNNDFLDYNYICGVDEAGRGPLAGPVVVSAVILKKDAFSTILADSKKLSEKTRESLFDWVIDNSVDYSIVVVSAEEIDRLNILQATLHGMKQSVLNLKIKPNIALFDGNYDPLKAAGRWSLVACEPPEPNDKRQETSDFSSKAIIKGDSIYSSIAAASILAKVTRDKIMFDLDKKYPEYNFKKHKGYPTKEHLELIIKHGINSEYRTSYKPVKNIIIANS